MGRLKERGISDEFARKERMSKISGWVTNNVNQIDEELRGHECIQQVRCTPDKQG